LLPPVPGSHPRRIDVYRALRNAVLQGLLAPGERMPSSRKAATDYGVSRGLLEEVYAQLVEEGLLERAAGRGTFVSREAPNGPAPAEDSKTPSVSARGTKLAANLSNRVPQEFRPFNSGIADAAEFPWNTWQRMQDRALRDMKPADRDFTDPRGLPALRRSLAHHLAQLRGLRCTAEQVIIFNSVQQALYLLALLLLDPRESAWMEDPGYPGARAALELAGAKLVPLPVDREGMQVALGLRRAPKARLAYVTPSHQFPTGVALSPERRAALLEWAAKREAWVLEDDFDGEFGHAGRPVTPLRSLDRHGRVLYLGTLSKSMFVSLRLAFAVVPEAMVEQLANLRTQLDAFSAPLTQLAMSRFMDEGHFSSHVRRMRGIYAVKCAALREGLSPLAERGWTWEDDTVGVQILLRHRDAREVRRIAKASGLALHLISSYRQSPAKDDGLLLRFGGLSVPAIQTGIARLVEAAVTG